MNEVDWNEMWKESRRNSTWRKVFGDNDTVEYWNRRAESFNRNAGDKRGEITVDKLVKLFGIHGTSTVLDIGAGTGRLAIPFARVAKSVTAVEPSREMMKFLKGLPNRLSSLFDVNNAACSLTVDLIFLVSLITADKALQRL